MTVPLTTIFFFAINPTMTDFLHITVCIDIEIQLVILVKILVKLTASNDQNMSDFPLNGGEVNSCHFPTLLHIVTKLLIFLLFD